MRMSSRSTVVAVVLTMVVASSAGAQRRVELGVDAGAGFGLGDRSSVSITIPASRFRIGFYEVGRRLSVEPAMGFSYDKAEGDDGIFTYNLELGAPFHFRPIMLSTEGGPVVSTPYLRPFVGLSGFSGGDNDDNEVSIGAGFGMKIPWRQNFAYRLEGSVGYGLDNEALRIGVLAGLSLFPR